MEAGKTQLEEGISQLVKNNEIIYSLLENSDNQKDKLSILLIKVN